MRTSLRGLLRAGALLALLLSSRGLAEQGVQGSPPPAASEQVAAVPELADLIPLATALSGRLASLEKAMADKGSSLGLSNSSRKSATACGRGCQAVPGAEDLRPAGGPTSVNSKRRSRARAIH